MTQGYVPPKGVSAAVPPPPGPVNGQQPFYVKQPDGSIAVTYDPETAKIRSSENNEGYYGPQDWQLGLQGQLNEQAAAGVGAIPKFASGFMSFGNLLPGATAWAYRASGDEDTADYIRDYQEQAGKSGAFKLGEVASLVAPALLSGGTSLGAEAGLGASAFELMPGLGQVSTAGRLAEGLGGRMASAALSEGALGSIGKAAITNGMRFGAEGAVMQLQSELGNRLLYNKDLSASAFSNAFGGGLMMGLGGAALGATGSAMGKLFGKIAAAGAKTGEEGAAEVIGRLGGKTEEATSLGYGKNELLQNLSKIHDLTLDKAGLNFTSDVGAMHKATAAAVEDLEATKRGLIKELDEIAPGTAPSMRDMFDRFRQRILNDPESGVKGTLGNKEAEQYLADLGRRVEHVEPPQTSNLAHYPEQSIMEAITRDVSKPGHFDAEVAGRAGSNMSVSSGGEIGLEAYSGKASRKTPSLAMIKKLGKAGSGAEVANDELAAGAMGNIERGTPANDFLGKAKLPNGVKANPGNDIAESLKMERGKVANDLAPGFSSAANDEIGGRTVANSFEHQKPTWKKIIDSRDQWYKRGKDVLEGTAKEAPYRKELDAAFTTYMDEEISRALSKADEYTGKGLKEQYETTESLRRVNTVFRDMTDRVSKDAGIASRAVDAGGMGKLAVAAALSFQHPIYAGMGLVSKMFGKDSSNYISRQLTQRAYMNAIGAKVAASTVSKKEAIRKAAASLFKPVVPKAAPAAISFKTRAEYEKHYERIAYMLSPQHEAEVADLSRRIAEMDPLMAKAIMDQFQRAKTYISAVMPKGRAASNAISLLPEAAPSEPSFQDWKFARVTNAISNPEQVFSKIATGEVNSDEIKAIRYVYPADAEELTSGLIKEALNMKSEGKHLDMNQAMSMAIALDKPMSDLQSPEFISQLQASINKPGKPIEGAPAPTQGSGVSAPQNLMTPLEKNLYT